MNCRASVSDANRLAFHRNALQLSQQLLPAHRKFRHPRFFGSVILSGKDGDDALPYQEKQVRNAVREVKK